MSRFLQRELLETRRQLEYFDPKELSMQLGGEPRRWGLVLIKELVDNALDACESARVMPEIGITLHTNGFIVEDNGPGMSEDLIERSLDYDVRISDKMYYVSPSRGQLGNALKCLWAAPYAIHEATPGHVEVISRGRRHRIAATVDRIAQEPRIQRTIDEDPICKNGTRITVHARKLACYHEWAGPGDFYKLAQDLIEHYAAFNPHSTFRFQAPGVTRTYPATTPGWKKWGPSDPTSPRWYAIDHLMALMSAYLHHERTPGVQPRTLRAFVSEFAGLSASAQQKAVLEAASLSGRHLRDLIVRDARGEKLDEDACETLLRMMQQYSRPISPKALGVLGKAHLSRVLSEHHQADPNTIDYKKVVGEAAGLPFVLEVAFGVTSKAQGLRIISGINWSATPRTPFTDLNGYLSTALVSESHDVVIVAHLAIPRPTFRDRGKQALAIPDEVEGEFEPSVAYVTRRFTEKRRQAIQSARADARAEDLMRRQTRAQYPNIIDVAYEIMPQAYMAASGQGRYVAHARQIMYAARPHILSVIHPDKAAKGLGAKYFTQTLLPDYMTEHPEETASWDVVFDDRGHFREPHRQNDRERIVGLGTLAVRQYIQSWTSQIHAAIGMVSVPFDVRTSGPTHRFQSALFIEKEGFDELIQQAQIAERFDIAPMSTKGMSNTAARRLVDELSQRGVTIYVLHDFDKSGLSILHTLRTDTRRYRFQSVPNVINLGLTLADVRELALQSEPVTTRQKVDPRLDLARSGATPDEQTFLFSGERRYNRSTDTSYWLGQRVELNAMTSDQFVTWIERQLTAQKVQKVVPSIETLNRTYRLAARTKQINREIAHLQSTQRQDPIAPPLGDLVAEVSWTLKRAPELSWDEALWTMIDADDSPGVTSDDARCW